MTKEQKRKSFRFVIPTEINLLGETWKVKCKSKVTNSKGIEVNGICKRIEKVIEINASCENPMKTYCHELSHAFGFMCYNTEVDLSENWATLCSWFWTSVIEETLKSSQNPEKQLTDKQLLKQFENIKDDANKNIKKIRHRIKQKGQKK